MRTAVSAINKYDSRNNFLHEVGYFRYILLFLCKEKTDPLTRTDYSIYIVGKRLGRWLPIGRYPTPMS